jgi:Mrp family chromosome partitioning ATPase
MGRMLDALRRIRESSHEPALANSPRLFLSQASEGASSKNGAPADQDMPFIEIGPNRSIEGSPEVIAAGASQPAVKQPSSPEPTPPPQDPPPDPPAAADRLLARLGPEYLTLHQPDHPVSRRYKELLLALLSGTRRNQPALLFSSPFSEAHTVQAVLELGLTAARHGWNTVVVDGGLRQASLASRVRLPRTPGAQDVLAGSEELGQCLRPTAQSNLHLLPAGESPAGQGLRLVSRTTRSLLGDLRKQFDLVLVACPSWTEMNDPSVAGFAGGLYLVLPEKEAESRRVDEVVRVIEEQGIRLAGLLLTNAMGGA